MEKWNMWRRNKLGDLLVICYVSNWWTFHSVYYIFWALKSLQKYFVHLNFLFWLQLNLLICILLEYAYEMKTNLPCLCKIVLHHIYRYTQTLPLILILNLKGKIAFQIMVYVIEYGKMANFLGFAALPKVSSLCLNLQNILLHQWT